MTKCHDQRHLINEALTWSLWLRPSHSSTTALFVWDVRRAFLYPHQSLSSGAQCGCRKHQGWITQILFHGSSPLYRWGLLSTSQSTSKPYDQPCQLNCIVSLWDWALIWNTESWQWHRFQGECFLDRHLVRHHYLLLSITHLILSESGRKQKFRKRHSTKNVPKDSWFLY